MAPLHQKLTNKTAVEKCKALKDVGKGMLNKQVAGKYRVPRNTVSAWVKNKEKSCYGLFWKLPLLLKCKNYSSDYFVNFS